jgi:hypothetical protein
MEIANCTLFILSVVIIHFISAGPYFYKTCSALLPCFNGVYDIPKAKKLL